MRGGFFTKFAALAHGGAFQNLVDAFATHTLKLCWRVDLAFIKADSTP